MPEKFSDDPMRSMVEADLVIDDMYGDNPNQKIDKQPIFEAAAKAPIAPDVMTYFTHLPDQSFTKKELIDALNTQVKARQREAAVGLFGVGAAEREAMRLRSQKQA